MIYLALAIVAVVVALRFQPAFGRRSYEPIIAFGLWDKHKGKELREALAQSNAHRACARSSGRYAL